MKQILVPPSWPVSGGKIAFVAEAPGEREEIEGEVLVGASGQEFSRICRDAGVVRSECLLTNVFNFKLFNNNVATICDGRKEIRELHPHYNSPAIAPGQYLRPEFFSCLDRLKWELEQVKPNIIVPLGNTALWAVCNLTGIGKYRGTVMESTLLPGTKVIPTYHPAAILRQWGFRSVMVADLMKIKDQAEFPEIRRPSRELWIRPSIEDLYEWERRYIRPGNIVCIDIETPHGFIACVGVSTSEKHGIVVPFVYRVNPDYSYWKTIEEEVQAWMWVGRILERADLPKLHQNGLYDIQWNFRKMGLKTKNALHDTMILHHALQPEMPKGLDFLGSIYTDEFAWKLMRPRGAKGEKRDE